MGALPSARPLAPFAARCRENAVGNHAIVAPRRMKIAYHVSRQRWERPPPGFAGGETPRGRGA